MIGFMSKFILSLSNDELDYVLSAILKEQNFRRAAARASNPDLQLTDDEKNLAKTDLIGAIKMYRARTGLDLRESKNAVENYRESIRHATEMKFP